MAVTEAIDTDGRARSARRWVVSGAVIVGVIAGWLGLGNVSGHRIESYVDTTDCNEPASMVDGGLRVEAKPDMRCDVTLAFQNRSWVPEHIIDVGMPFGGRAGGARVVMVPFGGDQPSSSRGIDGHVPADVWLRPGQRRTMKVTLVYRPDGCGSAGALGFPWPVLKVQSLGLLVSSENDEWLHIHAAKTVTCPD